jgi:hypothetical protein
MDGPASKAAELGVIDGWEMEIGLDLQRQLIGKRRALDEFPKHQERYLPHKLQEQKSMAALEGTAQRSASLSSASLDSHQK